MPAESNQLTIKSANLKSAGSKLEGIQILRAVAAIGVVFTHSTLQYFIFFHVPKSNLITKIARGTGCGVDLFFVISGFIITYISRKTGINPFNFILKRIIRITPIYWFYTTLTLLVYVFSRELIRNNSVSASYIIDSYLFFPAARPNDGVIHPVLGLGWTLNYEFFFYVIFSFALLFATQVRQYYMAAVFVLLVIVGFLIPPNYISIHFWTDPIILEFVFGVILATIYIKNIRIAALWCYIIFAISIIFWFISTYYSGLPILKFRVIFWGIPSLGVLSSTVLSSKNVSNADSVLKRLMVKIGDASYSLYLVHMFVIRVMTIFLLKIHFRPMAAFTSITLTFLTVLTITIAILVSFVSYKYLELPFLTLAKKDFIKNKNS
jgi:exopolysaccharide production protein ExoZ